MVSSFSGHRVFRHTGFTSPTDFTAFPTFAHNAHSSLSQIFLRVHTPTATPAYTTTDTCLAFLAFFAKLARFTVLKTESLSCVMAKSITSIRFAHPTDLHLTDLHLTCVLSTRQFMQPHAWYDSIRFDGRTSLI